MPDNTRRKQLQTRPASYIKTLQHLRPRRHVYKQDKRFCCCQSFRHTSHTLYPVLRGISASRDSNPPSFYRRCPKPTRCASSTSHPQVQTRAPSVSRANNSGSRLSYTRLYEHSVSRFPKRCVCCQRFLDCGHWGITGKSDQDRTSPPLVC